MNRRDALKTAGLVAGGALLASSGILEACRTGRAQGSRVLSDEDQALAEEIADTLLPTTAGSPGAKAAGTGAAMNLILTDCYKPEEQHAFREGLERFRAENFLERSRADRETFVRSVGRQAWFQPVRDLALGAYFSSEIGMTQALRYVRVPGKFVGCMPLEPGQPAWG
ncbi:MAG TPA: gluconate 2-dehydrogenase subunit 3 family protein [Gemmatimonadales bacterium]|nr:gluconate 2-dehydrogenase subunit 3 family protein [Gemmatimonadales bacterium]